MIKIQGMQKLTLLDYPGKVACTLFTSGCNFRCPFCHNAELVVGTEAPPLSEEEVLAFLKKRAGLLDGASASAAVSLCCSASWAHFAECTAVRLSDQAGYQRQPAAGAQGIGRAGAGGLCGDGYQKCAG